MNVRYQADADLNHAIVTGVLRRESAVDFQSAFVAGLEGVKDSDVLVIAAQQQRVLVSHDRKTMPTEFAAFITNSLHRRSHYRFKKDTDRSYYRRIVNNLGGI